MPSATNPIQKISVIVLTYNRKELLGTCLDSIREQDYPSVEVIVVDNNSTDGTSTMIREEFDWVNYIGLDENQGIAARNRGFEQASGDLVVSLDDDSEFPSANILTRISQRFRENENLGIAGFRLINGDGQEQEWFTWEKEGSIQDGFKSPTFVACGAAIDPKILERIGGFWEPYFMYLEERDLALRTINSGSEVRYFPNISIIHRSRDARREESRYIYFKTRNTFWFIWRNFPFLIAIWKTLLTVTGLGWMALQKGGFGLYLKGLWDVPKEFGDVLRTRDPVSRDNLNWVEGRFHPSDETQ